MRRRFLGSYGARICNAGSLALPGISRSMVRLNSTACWGRGWKGSVGRWNLPDQPWVLCPPELAEDDALSAAVLGVHQAILRDQLQGDPSLNPDLDIQQRALRRVEDWRVLLLLTPWMLARLLFPDRSPSLALPGGWSAPERTNAPYQVLGPRILFSLLGQSQQAHLSYHRTWATFFCSPFASTWSPTRTPRPSSRPGARSFVPVMKIWRRPGGTAPCRKRCPGGSCSPGSGSERAQPRYRFAGADRARLLTRQGLNRTNWQAPAPGSPPV
jgi:hypothetical protein